MDYIQVKGESGKYLNVQVDSACVNEHSLRAAFGVEDDMLIGLFVLANGVKIAIM